MPFTRGAIRTLATLAAFAGCIGVEVRAAAATCPASRYAPQGETREALVLEAGVLASSQRYGDARATYLSVLTRWPEDAETLFGLARIDAWEGCRALAEQSYRKALQAAPHDDEIRAGLIDLLTWEARYAEAERLIDEGLALKPDAPALLARRARLRYWQGDARAGVLDAERALAASPNDTDLREARDRMFVGEARAAARLDHYPSAYPDLYTLSAQALQRVKRFELWGGAQLLRREGGVESKGAVNDARFPVGVAYRPTIGTAVGAELAWGTPARAIPNWAVRVFVMAPLTSTISASLSYSYWNFPNGARVHIVHPSVGWQLTDAMRLDARAWISSVTLLATGDLTQQGSTELAVAAGPGVSWAVAPRTTLGAFYTYGAELDQNPSLYQITTFVSHAAGVFADLRLAPRWGLRPLVGLQHREGGGRPDIWISTVELGAYARW